MPKVQLIKAARYNYKGTVIAKGQVVDISAKDRNELVLRSGKGFFVDYVPPEEQTAEFEILPEDDEADGAAEAVPAHLDEGAGESPDVPDSPDVKVVETEEAPKPKAKAKPKRPAQAKKAATARSGGRGSDVVNQRSGGVRITGGSQARKEEIV